MHWRLFGAVYYLKQTADDPECDGGFIEVSPVLSQIARNRGFFALGFDRTLYRSLRPLEQRLAVYLAKKFVSQAVHRRFVEDLARALPIEATRPRDVRAILADAGEGLIEKRLPILGSARMKESRSGRWVAEYERNVFAKAGTRGASRPSTPSSPSRLLQEQVERIITATGNPRDRAWWTRCVRQLGTHAVDRGLGQLKEACQLRNVRNPAALLTKIMKDLADEVGIEL
jgi:hypothetical protein